ncbi:hypothetical protein [Aquariibacter albus]|uniref:Uncharacterized protein n=1 Tax=Aquariibacter albus TaxID=2759899 RepID=A0A839HIC8_9BURK|nr:hypothetical protein [Aquariibacter albus]MBB1161226.1 hypothetical protein [Aquariibacter albus]
MYLDLMSTIRERLDLISKISGEGGGDFGRAETAAFHGRKIIEGIAFGCIVATDVGLKYIPREAKGQWNAETILGSLHKKALNTFPNPSVLRKATPEEHAEHNVSIAVDGVPERRISTNELVAMYKRMHRWLHELNPYVMADKVIFHANNGQSLWNDLAAIERFIERHFISLSGQGFFCTLRDGADNQTKVVPLSKVAELVQGAT